MLEQKSIEIREIVEKNKKIKSGCKKTKCLRGDVSWSCKRNRLKIWHTGGNVRGPDGMERSREGWHLQCLVRCVPCLVRSLG